jgi:ligand-binding sensor domain-containing protein/serine phosphatase RsbU (regulator of sigma subunit)
MLRSLYISISCIFLLTGFSWSYLNAQINSIRGELFTALNGLTQTHVTIVYQDSIGFLWVGTQDGLNKYDGYSFQHFRNQLLDSNSISNNFISSITEDSDGNLWIGTNRGLNRLDRKTGFFSVYFPTESGSTVLGEPVVHRVCVDRKDNVWFRTNNYLEVLNPDSGIIKSYRFYNDPFNPISGTPVYQIFEDKQGQIWLGSKDGLQLFIPGKKEFKRFIHDPSDKNSISNNNVRAIFEDSRNILWIGTDEGLNIFNPAMSTFLRIPLNNFTNTRDNRINTISEDSNGRIWAGTDMGFFVMTPDWKISGKYSDINFFNREIQISSVYSIIEDHSEIIWMGTYEGLVKIDQKRKKFNILNNSNGGFPQLSSNNIFSIYEDNKGRLWIGTWGYGLNIIDYERNKVNLYSKATGDPGHRIASDYILTIYPDNMDRIWVGTSDGVNYFDKKTDRLYQFCKKSKNVSCNIFTNNNVYAIVEDFVGSIWFATANGIYRYIETNDEIRSYNKIKTGIETSEIHSVYCLVEDPEGRIWAGTADGLLLYNPIEDAFHFYPEKSSLSTAGLSSQTVYSLFVDSRSVLWIGTSSGLNRYNRADGNFTSFPGIKGLMINQILGILEDQTNSLWLSTNRGLLRFDPATGEYTTFNLSDGLQDYEFNPGSAFKNASGELFFGGISGLNYFYPDSLSYNEHIPTVSFTNFEITGEWGHTSLPLERTLSVEVMKGNRTFTVGFAALDFTSPENNRYRYKMVKQGSSGSWIDFGNQHNVTFYNLPPGSYIFSVKGSNNDNFWNHREVSLTVNVPPPFWNSWEAYLIYGLLSVLLIYLLIQLRTRSLRQSNKMLKEKEVAAKEIEKQREELMVKNRSITDSIIYAQRIQMALLPSNDMFKKVLPDSFILYKPKDIVSGDFYWINTDKEKIYVAAVDCTGHGVPGAFVSIIGFELFRKITSGEGVKNPAEILGSLNSNFTEIFSDGQHVYLNDGMDLNLCVLDRNEKSLEYSGAFNPLYIIRDETIIEIKANRFSIGADVHLSRGELNFKSHKVALEKDDILYLFSDGYSDQFGGPEGKKFKYRRFRHLLLTIHKIPMERQLAILEASIEEWRGDYEQVDDIMVIGIRPDFWKT